MKLSAFRIRYYRSIVDTEWCKLSSDNITGLIGQNESGKSAVLEALNSFFTKNLDKNCLRSDDNIPEISCEFTLNSAELKEILQDFILPRNFLKTLEKNDWKVSFKRTWGGSFDEKGSKITLESEHITSFFTELITEEPAAAAEGTPEATQTAKGTTTEKQEGAVGEPEPQKPILSHTDFINCIIKAMPEFVFFRDNESLLPATIDLEDVINENTSTPGIRGARNFLTIVGLDPSQISNSDDRMASVKIQRANNKLTKEFQGFWRQYIGKVNNKIEIAFDLKHYKDSAGDKAGKPYLIFWVKDGEDLLYPAQRSKGVQWFLSFYLQLQASAKTSIKGQVLLIDEPGASLHAKAQGDVLDVFENIKRKLQIVYTTHSPYLIDAKTLYRLLAVQRSNAEDDNSETKIFGVHELGSASRDTLFPVYTLIGVDLQHQQAVKDKNNIILEEPSAYYYLMAFKILLHEEHEMNFLPATGVTNIPLFVSLFLGWGLDFIVLADGDRAGKQTVRELKRDVYGGSLTESRKHLFNLDDGQEGIEDIFTKGDFETHIVKKKFTETGKANSKLMLESEDSKLLPAVNLYQTVKDGGITLTAFSKTTQTNIQSLVKRLVEALKAL